VRNGADDMARGSSSHQLQGLVAAYSCQRHANDYQQFYKINLIVLLSQEFY
jgi:hypothetical protein